jgi:hypothetical protein
MEQTNFREVPGGERGARLDAARRRLLIRRVSKFLPFLLSKFEAQLGSARAAATPQFMRPARAGGDGFSVVAGRAMRAQAIRWWAAIAEAGQERGVPVLFVIHDLSSWPGSGQLEAGLSEVAAQYPNVSVVRMSPESVGLDGTDVAQLRQTIHDTLSLRRDPHANALQHRLIAQTMAGYLTRSGVIDTLVARQASPVSPRAGAGH